MKTTVSVKVNSPYFGRSNFIVGELDFLPNVGEFFYFFGGNSLQSMYDNLTQEGVCNFELKYPSKKLTIDEFGNWITSESSFIVKKRNFSVTPDGLFVEIEVNIFDLAKS